MILSGDDLTTIPPARAGDAAQAAAADGAGGPVRRRDPARRPPEDGGRAPGCACSTTRTSPRPIAVKLERPADVTDFWSGSSLGKKEGSFEVTLPAHGARLLVCR